MAPFGVAASNLGGALTPVRFQTGQQSNVFEPDDALTGIERRPAGLVVIMIMINVEYTKTARLQGTLPRDYHQTPRIQIVA